MLSSKELTQIIEDAQSLKYLAQSYSEAAASKLKRIRNGIERNRSFLNEIASMYLTIKMVVMQRQIPIQSQMSPFINIASKANIITNKYVPFGRTKNTLISMLKPKSTVSVLLTSNYRFYGSLEQSLVQFYLENVKRFKTDFIIIGKTANEYLSFIKFKNFTTIVFRADMPNATELKTLVEETKKYERILVYHSKFQSVLNQSSFITDLKETQLEATVPKKKIDYIFEPEINRMLSFFDTQISVLLFEQTFLESELARTAARLISMDTAQDNANTFILNQKKLLSQTSRSIYNSRLLNTIATTFAIGLKEGKQFYDRSD